MKLVKVRLHNTEASSTKKKGGPAHQLQCPHANLTTGKWELRRGFCTLVFFIGQVVRHYKVGVCRCAWLVIRAFANILSEHAECIYYARLSGVMFNEQLTHRTKGSTK